MTILSAPLGSSSFYTPALANLRESQAAFAANTQRLSSGNRIINAADDVASFSIAAGLQSQLSTIKQVNSNIAQGSSLLQVATGGLRQIGTILDTLKTLSVQANSSALTNTERSYIQQQFTSLVEQIDSIASTTSFNGIKLLDGSLAGGNQLLTQSTAATQASGSITLSDNPANAETIVLNGATFTAGTDFTIGGDAAASASNLATALNASTDVRISQATYVANGATINITAKAGGKSGNNFIIDKAASTADFTVGGDTTVAANVHTLAGGADNNGIHINSTKATGSINETLITAQSQVAASVTFALSGAVADNETLLIGDGNGGNVTFTFKNAAVGATQVQIGASAEETLQNLVQKLSSYDTSSDYGIRQLKYSINGATVTLKNKTIGNVNDLDGAALTISDTVANGSLSAASFNNGANGGVNVSGVTGSGFTGSITGFTATYIGADVVDASLTVGSNTYTARISDTTPGGNTTVRFSSENGGFFDVQLAASAGSAVGNQTQADSYAARLDAAFSQLEFTQDKPVTNFAPIGDLANSSFRLQTGSGNTPRINAISVTAPQSPGGDATIEFTLGSSTFRNTSLGSSIGALESVKFTNTADATQVITFTNGANAIDLSTEEAAADLEEQLVDALNVGEAGSGTDFQIGADAENTLNVSIGSVSSFSLFNGTSVSVGTQLNAVAAQTQLDTARGAVQTIISHVAGKQTALDFAAANLQQSITAITQAHSALADTDIVAESTDFATNALKVNSGIAVIAQALSLPSSLLTVLRASGNS